MMRVIFASLAAGEPMGQQAYEREIAAALATLTPVPQVELRPLSVKSWRSSLKADVRLPLSALHRAPLWLQYSAGLRTYGARSLVHRLDLRLPPARREVTTVHDLAPLRFPDEGQLPAHAAETLRRSKRVICPSKFA